MSRYGSGEFVGFHRLEIRGVWMELEGEVFLGVGGFSIYGWLGVVNGIFKWIR